MSIEFSCSNCLTSIRVPESAAGKKAQCPACNGVCDVPSTGLPPLDHTLEAATPEIVAPNPFAAGASQHAANGGLHQVSVGERLELADRGSRLVARIVDGFAMFLPGFLIAGVGIFLAESMEGDAGGIIGMMLIIVGITAFLAVAIINMVWMSTSGETIGKRVMKVRVVKDADGRPPGFVHGVLLRSWLMAILNQVPFLGLVDALMIFGDKRQCLHDMIASTRVVQGRYQGSGR